MIAAEVPLIYEGPPSNPFTPVYTFWQQTACSLIGAIFAGTSSGKGLT